MLDTEPAEAGKIPRATWRNMGTLSLKRLETLAPKYAKINLTSNLKFHRWTDANGWLCEGTVDRTSLKPEGIVRRVAADQGIDEGQFHDGWENGYYRLIWPDGSYEVGWNREGLEYGPWVEYSASG